MWGLVEHLCWETLGSKFGGELRSVRAHIVIEVCVRVWEEHDLPICPRGCPPPCPPYAVSLSCRPVLEEPTTSEDSGDSAEEWQLRQQQHEQQQMRHYRT